MVSLAGTENGTSFGSCRVVPVGDVALPNGSRVAAWSAGVLLGCSSAPTPELKLWPANDASSPAASATQSSGAGSAGSGSNSATSDGASAVGPTIGDAGVPSQQPTGAGAAAPADSGAPPFGTPDAAAHGPPPDAGTPKSHALTVVVTTVDNGQGYSPENVGAIWVAQSSGAFVETLQEWGKVREDYLVLWNQVTSAAGTPASTVDAITGATEYAFGTHVVYWDFSDASGKAMPDGDYRVYFETADCACAGVIVPGPNTFIDFTKGPTDATFTFPDTPSFANMELILSP